MARNKKEQPAGSTSTSTAVTPATPAAPAKTSGKAPKAAAPATPATPVVAVQEGPMNKTQFIDYVLSSAKYEAQGAQKPVFETKAECRRAMDAFLNGIVSAVSQGDGVSLTGYITVKTRVRPARKGAKVFGETRDLAAKIVPQLKAGKKLKDAAASSN